MNRVHISHGRNKTLNGPAHNRMRTYLESHAAATQISDTLGIVRAAQHLNCSIHHSGCCCYCKQVAISSKSAVAQPSSIGIAQRSSICMCSWSASFPPDRAASLSPFARYLRNSCRTKVIFCDCVAYSSSLGWTRSVYREKQQRI